MTAARRVRSLARRLLWVALLPCCAGTPAGEAPPREVPLQLRGQQLIVAVPLVTPAVRGELARRLARQHDLELLGAFPLDSIDVHCIVYEVPADRDVDRLIDSLASTPGVQLVQRNQRFDGMESGYSDPYATFQHGAAALRAEAAHRWATGRGVRIGVVDTGVDTRHPDLSERVVAVRNFVEGGDASFERDAHGTAVAGIIAARADDGQGIFGIAPDAELVVAKACWHRDASDGGALCSSWTLARAIDWALQADVRVLNLSLAGPEDRLLARLLTTADERGVVSVAAAGEDAAHPGFPASLDVVLGVVASDSPGSSPHPDAHTAGPVLAAPGHEIVTTAPGARYRFLSGSSLSTAHVAGAVALVVEQDPGLSPAAVRALLEETARAQGRPRRPPSMGSVDACAALHRLRGGEGCR
ncbi:MAG: S8 family serine peptidase [Myxococcota bacterium]|nr:S8 family serine peptidase [Myxococcota bacterium]